MNEREELGRRLYEACLSGSVPALDALIEKDPLILSRVNSLTRFLNETPLHVAASCGHLDFTKALLSQKPKLATELDSLRCSPLHLASAEGHFEIVQELLRVTTDVCNTRDQDGRIPLHLAAMKGRVNVISELLRAEQDSIDEKFDKGETVLHLCVSYNRLEALKTLVQYLQSNDKEYLLNYGDDDGNTILHLAATLKQINTVEYLVGIKGVNDHANVENREGYTALDVVDHCPNKDRKTMKIREFLLQAGTVGSSICGGPDPNPESPPGNASPPPTQRRCKAGVLLQWIYRFWIKYFKADHTWLKEVRGHLITAATLTATMAYQAILSPPGGFWQDNGGDVASLSRAHSAGRAILDKNYDDDENSAIFSDYYSAYYYNRSPITDYLLINTAVLIGSLCTIMLALSGFPINNKFLVWLLVFTVYTTISCLALSYSTIIYVVFPESILPKYGEIRVLLFCFISTGGFIVLIHACHFLVWTWNKLRKFVSMWNKFVWLWNKLENLVNKGCHISSRGAGAWETHTIPNEVNPGSSHKCLGNFC